MLPFLKLVNSGIKNEGREGLPLGFAKWVSCWPAIRLLSRTGRESPNVFQSSMLSAFSWALRIW